MNNRCDTNMPDPKSDHNLWGDLVVKPEELLFAKTHEWVHVVQQNGDRLVTVGLSAFAVEALTDLVFIELPNVGADVVAGQSMAEVESVKAVSDIYAPLSGEVVEVNESLPDALDTLSEDPFGAGWIARIRLTDESGLEDLMSHADYQSQCAEES
jgi:glycine cleavage system H protein